MKKSLLIITVILTGTFNSAFAGGIDPILAHTWDLNGDNVIFGQDNTYKNTSDGGSGSYGVSKELSGSADSKEGLIGLTIKQATDKSWPAGNYSTCPVKWTRQDWMKTTTKIKTYQVQDPQTGNMVTVQEPYTVSEKVGDIYSLSVKCDPGELILQRKESSVASK